MKLFILILFIHQIYCVLGDDDLLILTHNGLVQGTTMTSRLDRPFSAFLGIPYAESPAGALRFLNPVPKQQWDGIFDATVDGPICSQPAFNPNANIQDDCLRLNIYTTDFNASKPVILYIHGGAFFIGSGLSDDSGPETLMDRDIVLVTINYRLGTSGFLGTATIDAPGNAGFKDQVLAMRWVRDNIATFGGNPNSVTLMGQSAGSISISAHLVSPMSAGLFHRAILMSGAVTAPWEIRNDILGFARNQSALFGCSTETTEEIIECLRAAPAAELGSTLSQLHEFSDQPVMHFYPIIEQDFGQEPFLVEDPNKSLLYGNYNKVPFIAGITQLEIIEPAWPILEDDELRTQFDENFIDLAPFAFLYEQFTNRSIYIGTRLRQAFLNFPLNADYESLHGLNTLFADSHISFGTHRFVQLSAVHADQPPIYYYENNYVGRYSHFNWPEDKPLGVAHTDDLQYVLRLRRLGPQLTQDDPENLTVERMTRLWTNFAATGNPNNPDDEYIGNINWTQFNPNEQNYLNIGDELVMSNNLNLERYAVWEELFPVIRWPYPGKK